MFKIINKIKNGAELLFECTCCENVYELGELMFDSSNELVICKCYSTSFKVIRRYKQQQK